MLLISLFYSQHFLAKVIQELKELWNAFKESRLSSLSNFLSLRHTAIVLEKLAKTRKTPNISSNQVLSLINIY